MTADQESRSPLETEPVQKLIVRYAIPTALTLMVNCLYNIVDQIFVGQGVGITAMAAINVAFPVVILVNAVALRWETAAPPTQPVLGRPPAARGG